ncbi:MAG: sulfotransferase domain-containing protein [bacterium]
MNFQQIKNLVKTHFLAGHNPDFIIIGAQKCGTTSLHYYLSQHPKLKGSRPKEIHYFDKWINYDYQLKWYKNHFNIMSFKKTLFFESSPNYIYYEEIARLIKEYFPGIKLILMLRNPVDRAYSAWNMYREMYERNKPDFSKRGGRFPGAPNYIYEYLMKGRSIFPGFSDVIQIEQELMSLENAPQEPAILRRGLYVDQIKDYLKYFDRENLHIIGFKDFATNTEKVLRSVYHFLEIPDYPFSDLNNEPKGKREYQKKMNQETQDYLNEFYKAKNLELFELLKFEPNW